MSEYVVTVAWLHAICNDFCMHRLSLVLEKFLEELEYWASGTLGAIWNVEDLRSLDIIYI